MVMKMVTKVSEIEDLNRMKKEKLMAMEVAKRGRIRDMCEVMEMMRVNEEKMEGKKKVEKQSKKAKVGRWGTDGRTVFAAPRRIGPLAQQPSVAPG